MFVRLEADLEDSVTESVAVEWLDRHQTLVVVGHGDEAEAFAFVCLEIPDDFHVLKRYKQLSVRGTAIETDKQSLPPYKFCLYCSTTHVTSQVLQPKSVNKRYRDITLVSVSIAQRIRLRLPFATPGLSPKHTGISQLKKQLPVMVMFS